MNLPELKHPGYTLADWAAWEGRWELIDGVAYDMTPAPSYEHQRVSARIGNLLFNQLEAGREKYGRPCELLHAPIDVFLGDSVVEPDLVVVCDPTKKTPRGIEGAPDLVVEILSPRNATKDLTRKRWLYEREGVPEYLILDPIEQVGILLRLEAGRYVEAAHVEWSGVIEVLGGTLSLTLGT